jgi:hypothetical protein
MARGLVTLSSTRNVRLEARNHGICDSELLSGSKEGISWPSWQPLAPERVTTRFFPFRGHRSIWPRPLRLLSDDSLAFDEFHARVPAAHSVAPETRSFRARPSCDQCSGRSPMVSFQSRCLLEQSVCHLGCCEFSTSLEKSMVITGRKPLVVAGF